jgi:SAM-dependent methyltransferase
MADYLKAYQQGIQKHGTDFEVTLWASPRTQQLRFDIFSQMYRLDGKSILDAGCSRGDLAQWLLDHGIAYRQYTGIDALEPVINFARSRNLPRASFHAGDFVSDVRLLSTNQPEVICISGSLNTMSDEEALKVLQAAWDAAGEALLFNFLSDRAGPAAPLQDRIARRLNTMALLDWAFEMTPDVTFRQDYFPHGHDATIRMKR